MMNSTIRKLAMLVAVVLTIGFFSAEQTAAQTPISSCKKLTASSVGTFNPATGTVSGPLTNGGILNGTLEDVLNFGAGVVFTPDPTVVSYTTSLTITTLWGQLKSSNVTTQSVVTAAGAEWGYINPDTSTGKFAGATGLIFIRFKPLGDPAVGPFESEITADICFANRDLP
jgi:hypothetical protein